MKGVVLSLVFLAGIAGAQTPPADSNRELLDRLNAMDSAHDASTPIEPRIGMTAEQVRQVLQANGRREKKITYTQRMRWTGTCDVNRTKRADSVQEQWVCGAKEFRTYLYFDDGVLTTIQENQ